MPAFPVGGSRRQLTYEGNRRGPVFTMMLPPFPGLIGRARSFDFFQIHTERRGPGRTLNAAAPVALSISTEH
jgi:hypothetical protein